LKREIYKEGRKFLKKKLRFSPWSRERTLARTFWLMKKITNYFATKEF